MKIEPGDFIQLGNRGKCLILAIDPIRRFWYVNVEQGVVMGTIYFTIDDVDVNNLSKDPPKEYRNEG